jgi:hypothetical protein
MFYATSEVLSSTKQVLHKFKLNYLVLSLLLVAQVLFGLVGKVSATYPGNNGQIIAGEQNQLVAFDPTNFDKEILKSFNSGDVVVRASANSTGVDVAYLLQTTSNELELRVYSRETGTVRLIRTVDGSSPDENGDNPPTSDISSISPDGNSVALSTDNISGDFVLLIVRLSDGATTARYTDARQAAGWNGDGSKIFATNEVNGIDSFGWFNTDGSGRIIVVPASSLATDVTALSTSLSPDGQHVLYSVANGTEFSVHEIGLDGNGDHLLAGGSDINNLALYGMYSPDGQRFVYEHIVGSFDNVQYVTRDLDGGAETEAASAFGQDLTHIEWTPTITTSPDTIPPVVTGVPDHSPNANGWYNANVNIDWQATDPDPSSGTPTDPANTLATQEGKDLTYTSDPSCDPAGNCATGTIKLSIDKTKPTGTFTGSALLLRLLGGNITGNAGDGLSGVSEVKLTQGSTTWSSKTGGLTLACNTAKTSCTWSVSSPSSLPLGSYSYTLTVIDLAGNTTTATKTYSVI